MRLRAALRRTDHGSLVSRATPVFLQLLAALLAIVAMAVPANAQQPVPRPAARGVSPDSGAVREVRRGDTLWDLARECLGDPYRWPEIYRLNTGIVADPDLIYPRESLRLPACRGAATAQGGVVAPAPPVRASMQPPSRTVFYREEGQQTSTSTLSEQLIASAPLTTTGEFYRAGILVHERTLRVMGTVEGVQSPTVVPVRSDPQIQPNNRIYLRLAFLVKEGDRLHFLRRDREVPPYGTVFVSTGIGTVEEVVDGTAVVQVDQLFHVVRNGDVAVPLAEFSAPAGELAGPAGGPTGRILAFERDTPVRQLHDLAFVDLGHQFGVTEGDELDVYLPPSREDWGIRPEMRVARLRVVRATERTSTVQVIGMDQPALRAGLPVRLVARAP